MPLAAIWVDLETIILKQISYDSAYMWNLKINTNELIYKTEIDSETEETNLGLPKGKSGGRDKLGVWG